MAIDMGTLEYVSACDNNLTCAICHSPLLRPVLLACDHIFCKDCLDSAVTNQTASLPTCPTCRRAIDHNRHLLSIPRIIIRMLDELVVYCPNRKMGCALEVHRSAVLDHINLYCPYAMVPCPSNDCDGMVRRKDIGRECGHTRITAECCGKSVMQLELEVGQILLVSTHRLCVSKGPFFELLKVLGKVLGMR